MMFRNRAEAGRELAGCLSKYSSTTDLLVLGIPRGGVPVAFEVAKQLHAPLDVLIVRKLGVPGQEELGFGAIASGGLRFLDAEIVEAVGISKRNLERITETEEKELKRRERAYRGARPPFDASGRTVIVVDDGIATGSSMQVAINAVRQMNPSHLIVAVPVAPVSTCHRLQAKVDDLVCVYMPRSFYAIGQYYEDFSQVSDEVVTELLAQAMPRKSRSAA